MFMSGALVGFSATFGSMLANINSYQNAQEFMARYSKECVVGGGLLLLFAKVPALRSLLIVGGLGYETYSIMSRTEKSLAKKAEDLGTMALGNGGIIGLSVGGAVLGQMAIPVPVVGAIIGGFIGGVVGGVGTSTIIDAFKKSKCRKLVEFLYEQLNETTGLWTVNSTIIAKLGTTD
jgi:hypothetical protein